MSVATVWAGPQGAGNPLLGLFTGLGLDGEATALLGTGFCGALTTYSAFAVQTHDLGPRRGTLFDGHRARGDHLDLD